MLGYAAASSWALDDKLKAAYEGGSEAESCELTPWPIHLNPDGDSQFSSLQPITEGITVRYLSHRPLPALSFMHVSTSRWAASANTSEQRQPGGFPNLHVRRGALCPPAL